MDAPAPRQVGGTGGGDASPADFSFQAFLFSPHGRASRFDYWVRFTLPYFAIVLALTQVDIETGYWDEWFRVGLFSSLFELAALWTGVVVAIRRCHDRDRGGWFLLWTGLPIIGWILLFIELGFLRGTVGPNRFGSDPVARR